MNDSLGIWLIGAGVVAMGLLLLLGGLAGSPEGELAPEADVIEAESAGVGSTYWQPVAEVTASPQVATTFVSSVAPVGATAPCPHCGSTAGVPMPPVPSSVGGCGYPDTPCGRPTCSRCHGQAAPIVPAARPGALAGGCGHVSAPCGEAPCAPVAPQCPYPRIDPCRAQKPGINRNLPICVDECSFVQLHSTVAHPICMQVRFEWSASKGWFLDPTASDPLFFAPTTQFYDGEDVWITLVVTDASGAQYSDVVSVHIRDLP
jgi:hypothetical protein